MWKLKWHLIGLLTIYSSQRQLTGKNQDWLDAVFDLSKPDIKVKQQMTATFVIIWNFLLQSA